ncbi:MAG: hypothetical protein LBD68_09840 [Zoogloeaceae bacterium]|jgi:hypothetical protein|nr:hypothetical protein [Zoogloeaceae bacterium]
MSAAFFDILRVADRLLEKAPGFAHVGVAASIDDIEAQINFRTPGAYVILPREEAAEAPKTPNTIAVTARFSVAIVVFRPRERALAQDLPTELVALIHQCRAALAGWVAPSPEQKATMILFESGGVERDNDATLTWLETYRTTHALLKTGG